MNSFGQKIKALRKSKGLSQEKLADLLDYDWSNYRKIEQGKRNPPIKILKSLSEILNVPIETLKILKLIDKCPEEYLPLMVAELKRLGFN